MTRAERCACDHADCPLPTGTCSSHEEILRYEVTEWEKSFLNSEVKEEFKHENIEEIRNKYCHKNKPKWPLSLSWCLVKKLRSAKDRKTGFGSSIGLTETQHFRDQHRNKTKWQQPRRQQVDMFGQVEKPQRGPREHAGQRSWCPQPNSSEPTRQHKDAGVGSEGSQSCGPPEFNELRQPGLRQLERRPRARPRDAPRGARRRGAGRATSWSRVQPSLATLALVPRIKRHRTLRDLNRTRHKRKIAVTRVRELPGEEGSTRETAFARSDYDHLKKHHNESKFMLITNSDTRAEPRASDRITLIAAPAALSARQWAAAAEAPTPQRAGPVDTSTDTTARTTSKTSTGSTEPAEFAVSTHITPNARFRTSTKSTLSAAPSSSTEMDGGELLMNMSSMSGVNDERAPSFLTANERVYWFFRNRRTVGVQTTTRSGAGARLYRGAGHTVGGGRICVRPCGEDEPPEPRPPLLFAALEETSTLASRLVAGTGHCFSEMQKKVFSQNTKAKGTKDQYVQYDKRDIYETSKPFVESEFRVLISKESGKRVKGDLNSRRISPPPTPSLQLPQPPQLLQLPPCYCQTTTKGASRLRYTDASQSTTELARWMKNKTLRKKVPKWKRCMKLCFDKEQPTCTCLSKKNRGLRCLFCKNNIACKCTGDVECSYCINTHEIQDPFMDPNFLRLVQDEVNFRNALKNKFVILKGTNKDIKRLESNINKTDPDRHQHMSTPVQCGWRTDDPTVRCKFCDITEGPKEIVETTIPCVCKPLEQLEEQYQTQTTITKEPKPCRWINKIVDGEMCLACYRPVCKCQCSSKKTKVISKNQENILNAPIAESEEQLNKQQKIASDSEVLYYAPIDDSEQLNKQQKIASDSEEIADSEEQLFNEQQKIASHSEVLYGPIAHSEQFNKQQKIASDSEEIADSEEQLFNEQQKIASHSEVLYAPIDDSEQLNKQQKVASDSEVLYAPIAKSDQLNKQQRIDSEVKIDTHPENVSRRGRTLNQSMDDYLDSKNISHDTTGKSIYGSLQHLEKKGVPIIPTTSSTFSSSGKRSENKKLITNPLHRNKEKNMLRDASAPKNSYDNRLTSKRSQSYLNKSSKTPSFHKYRTPTEESLKCCRTNHKAVKSTSTKEFKDQCTCCQNSSMNFFSNLCSSIPKLLGINVVNNDFNTKHDTKGKSTLSKTDKSEYQDNRVLRTRPLQGELRQKTLITRTSSKSASEKPYVTNKTASQYNTDDAIDKNKFKIDQGTEIKKPTKYNLGENKATTTTQLISDNNELLQKSFDFKDNFSSVVNKTDTRPHINKKTVGEHMSDGYFGEIQEKKVPTNLRTNGTQKVSNKYPSIYNREQYHDQKTRQNVPSQDNVQTKSIPSTCLHKTCTTLSKNNFSNKMQIKEDTMQDKSLQSLSPQTYKYSHRAEQVVLDNKTIARDNLNRSSPLKSSSDIHLEVAKNNIRPFQKNKGVGKSIPNKYLDIPHPDKEPVKTSTNVTHKTTDTFPPIYNHNQYPNKPTEDSIQEKRSTTGEYENIPDKYIIETISASSTSLYKTETILISKKEKYFNKDVNDKINCIQNELLPSLSHQTYRDCHLTKVKNKQERLDDSVITNEYAISSSQVKSNKENHLNKIETGTRLIQKNVGVGASITGKYFDIRQDDEESIKARNNETCESVNKTPSLYIHQQQNQGRGVTDSRINTSPDITHIKPVADTKSRKPLFDSIDLTHKSLKQSSSHDRGQQLYNKATNTKTLNQDNIKDKNVAVITSSSITIVIYSKGKFKLVEEKPGKSDTILDTKNIKEKYFNKTDKQQELAMLEVSVEDETINKMPSTTNIIYNCPNKNKKSANEINNNKRLKAINVATKHIIHDKYQDTRNILRENVTDRSKLKDYTHKLSDITNTTIRPFQESKGLEENISMHDRKKLTQDRFGFKDKSVQSFPPTNHKNDLLDDGKSNQIFVQNDITASDKAAISRQLLKEKKESESLRKESFETEQTKTKRLQARMEDKGGGINTSAKIIHTKANTVIKEEKPFLDSIEQAHLQVLNNCYCKPSNYDREQQHYNQITKKTLIKDNVKEKYKSDITSSTISNNDTYDQDNSKKKVIRQNKGVPNTSVSLLVQNKAGPSEKVYFEKSVSKHVHEKGFDEANEKKGLTKYLFGGSDKRTKNMATVPVKSKPSITCQCHDDIKTPKQSRKDHQCCKSRCDDDIIVIKACTLDSINDKDSFKYSISSKVYQIEHKDEISTKNKLLNKNRELGENNLVNKKIFNSKPIKFKKDIYVVSSTELTSRDISPYITNTAERQDSISNIRKEYNHTSATNSKSNKKVHDYKKETVLMQSYDESKKRVHHKQSVNLRTIITPVPHIDTACTCTSPKYYQKKETRRLQLLEKDTSNPALKKDLKPKDTEFHFSATRGPPSCDCNQAIQKHGQHHHLRRKNVKSNKASVLTHNVAVQFSLSSRAIKKKSIDSFSSYLPSNGYKTKESYTSIIKWMQLQDRTNNIDEYVDDSYSTLEDANEIRYSLDVSKSTRKVGSCSPCERGGGGACGASLARARPGRHALRAVTDAHATRNRNSFFH